MHSKLSREFEEKFGVKQGHINSGDNYKIYINPALNTLEGSTLGVLAQLCEEAFSYSLASIKYVRFRLALSLV